MRIALTVVRYVNTFRTCYHDNLSPLVGGCLSNAAVVNEGMADAMQVQEAVECSAAFPFGVLLWSREDQEVRVQGKVLLYGGRTKLLERPGWDGSAEKVQLKIHSLTNGIVSGMLGVFTNLIHRVDEFPCES